MKSLILVLSVATLWPAAPARAQLLPPNDMGVTMGHIHLSVRDVEAHKKFWVMVGGTALTIDGTDVIKFPGVYYFLTPAKPPVGKGPAKELTVICGCPSDGFEPSVINHLGFLVQDFDALMAKFKAAGVTLKE